MNIQELQREIYETAVAKGWHDRQLREPPIRDGVFGPPAIVHTDRVLAKLALIHSELCEAEIEADADRWGVYYHEDKPSKPEGWIVEIADALIRALDMCAALGLVIQDEVEGASVRPRLSLHCFVAYATEAARDGDYTGRFLHGLAWLWVAAHVKADERGLDLDAAIQLKIVYNRTRPHRHGGRLA